MSATRAAPLAALSPAARTNARTCAQGPASASTRSRTEAQHGRGWRRTYLTGLLVGISTACRDDAPPTGPAAGPAPSLDIVAGDVVAGGLTTISTIQPNFLKASSINLYWTFNQKPVDDVNYDTRAVVYRASKSGSPGSEQVLYSETTHNSHVDFHGVTYANLGGSYYGYFVACYSATASCKIKRIPLLGGPAVTLAVLPARAEGPLETDGKFLYWPDIQALRRMPIGGGAVATLAGFGTWPRVKSISLTSTHVYYADGAGVRRVPKDGGAVSTVATDAGANHVFTHEANGVTTVYWTAANAAVRSRVVGTTVPSPTVTQWSGKPGRLGTSVGFDGTRLLWTDCEGYPPSTPSGCYAWRRVGDVVTKLASVSGRYNVAALEWDAGATFVALGSGTKKYVH